MKSQENIFQAMSEAIVGMIQTDGYYNASLISTMKRVYTKEIPTLGVGVKDAQINLYINVDFFLSLSVKSRIEVLLHECEHIRRGHLWRAKDIIGDADKFGNRHKLANVCMDSQINRPLKKLVEEVGGVTVDSIREMVENPNDVKEDDAWENYYSMLKHKAENADQKMQELLDKAVDDHSKWHEGDGENSDMVKAACKKALTDAANNSGGIGNAPADVLATLGELEKSKVSWKGHLRRFHAKLLNYSKTKTRMKRNRRYGYIFQGKRKKPELSIALCFDSSGSVSDREIKQYFAEFKALHQLGVDLHVIECDTRVANVYKYDPKFPPTLKSRGGTNYQPAIDRAMELGVDGIIYFGDMGCFDTPRNPKVPFIWAATQGASRPNGVDFGHLINIEIEGI